RATIPGRLVPPPIPRMRPEAPTSFPAEIARARRAWRNGPRRARVWGRGVAGSAAGVSAIVFFVVCLSSLIIQNGPLCLQRSLFLGQYNKTRGNGQENAAG